MTRPEFRVRIGQSQADLHAAQRLRYQVFVAELGGDGAMVDHALGREADQFDAHATHLLLEDVSRPAGDQVVGTYRVMTLAQAQAAGRFYSASEYDLSPLLSSGRDLMELGRSCLHPDYRGGPALFHLWQGLAALVRDRNIDVLFGVASFHGTDLTALAQPLSYLHHHHRAPTGLRVSALTDHAKPMDVLPLEAVDRKAAMVAMPALIKAYLRMGAVVGDGVFVDDDFNTTDVSLIVDVTAMDARQKTIYAQGAIV